MASNDFEHDNPETVNVGFHREYSVHCKFRSHVVEKDSEFITNEGMNENSYVNQSVRSYLLSSDKPVGTSFVLIITKYFGQPKIRYLGIELRVEENIAGL